MTPGPLWITEADVVGLISTADALSAVERVLMLESRGDAVAMAKTFVRIGDQTRSLQALGAAAPATDLAVTKTWLQTPRGGWPLLVMFDATTGHKRAVIEATALSQMRTGALAGVATRWLADATADELGIVGTGRQAWTQVAAVAAARKLKRLRIWSPTAAHRNRFAQAMRRAFGFAVSEEDSAAEAVADAPIVTIAAHVTGPILSSAMVARGTHINAVSVTVSGRAELDLDIFPRVAVVCTDSVSGVRSLSDEFQAYYQPRNGWDQIRPLAAIVAGATRRPPDADLTLYKGMGTGIADLALAAEIVRRAQERGVGLRLPDTMLVDPPLGGP